MRPVDMVPVWLSPAVGRSDLIHVVRELDNSGRLRGVLPTSDEAYSRADTLTSVGEVETGLTWLWVAANLGHQQACSRLARHIADEAQNVRCPLSPTHVINLIQGWLSAADVSSHDMSGQLGEDGAHSFVAVPSLGDADSREGRDIAKRLGHIIGVPLPLKGRLPEPGELAAEFVRAFPWAPNIARYLEGQLALLRSCGSAHPKLPNLLLVGPPGCGKSTMLEWLATRCQIPNVVIPVGGTSDSVGLIAVSRGWLTAQPSAPVQAMNELGCANPAIILDELDKGVSDTSGRNGSVTGALLAMLRPPSEGYRDIYLMAPVRLNHVSFLASANSLSPIPDALRSRFVIHSVPAPQPCHFESLLPNVILNEAGRLGVDPGFLPWISDTDRAWLKTVFVSSKGSIRSLEDAYRLIIGEKAAEESMSMQRPN